MKNNKTNINTSSMADIAFLLLIFFLVSTTIDQDQGMLSKLPSIQIIEKQPIHKRNIMEINLNSKNNILINSKIVAINEIKQNAIKHIKNNGKDVNLSEEPHKAVFFNTK